MATRWQGLGVVAAGLALVVLAGCGDDDPEPAGAGDPAATGETAPDETAPDAASTDEAPTDEAGPDLAPPGTALADGLQVPEGAHLAGTVFPQDDGWSALLALDPGEIDPFAVFDALAADVRAAGPALPGSADSCSWELPALDAASGPGPSVAVAGPPPPRDEIRALACEATAGDGAVSFTLRLDWGDDHPGTILVTRGVAGRSFAIGSRGEPYGETTGDPDDGPAPACASGCDEAIADPGPPPTRQPPDTLPPTGPDPVPAEAVALLPERPAAEDPAPGDPFGGESGCFATLRARFHLPDGAAVAATVGGYDATTVLAVDDLEAVLEALRDEAGAADLEGIEGGEIQEVPLGDGSTVRLMSLLGGAGGGCSFRGSPDGRHLLVEMGPD